MEHSVLNQILLLLALSVLAVALLRRWHLPPILGYLFVGVLVGPASFGLVPDSATLHLLGEVGVVFLLFMIGLEVSIPHLLAMKTIVLGLGGAQVLATGVITGGVALLAGIPWQGSLILGGALALSSTAIVAKQLVEQLEMQTRHGRIALGVLLFQDLAVVPFLVIIPILAGGSDQGMLMPLLWALTKGLAAFMIMFAAGHWALRPLFHIVAGARSIELFTLTIILVALAAAWVTYEMGLSLALGAFLAGMMLGETEYRHQIETEIRPFRDLLMGLFFISVGAQLSPWSLLDTWHWVFLITLGLIAGKALLVILLVRLFGYETGVALRSGIALGQAGEFGFALLTLAMNEKLLELDTVQPLFSAIVLSMVISPLLIRHNGELAKRFCIAYMRQEEMREEKIAEATQDLSGHVIICGFGRIGQNLARFLREEGFEYVALDLDSTLIREAWQAGERVYFGDSSHPEILEAAGLSRARALVITFDEFHVSRGIIQAVRHHDSELPVIVRTHNDLHLEELEQAGATEVVPESIEASMMLADHLLERLGVPAEEVHRLVEKARASHYAELRGVFHGEEIEDADELEAKRLHTVVLEPGSWAIDKTIGELQFDSMNVEVNSLRRGDIRGDSPSADMQLLMGDVLVLLGPADQLQHAEERLLKG